MTESKRHKILIVAIVILVITNIASLSYMWSYKRDYSTPPLHNNNDNRGGMGNFVVRELGFDSVQTAQYHELRDRFVTKQKVLIDSVKNLRKEFYEQLTTDQLDSTSIEGYAQRISDVQALLDARTFNHFRRVKAICTPEQAAKYDTITKEVIKRMIEPRWRNNRQGPPPPPPHDSMMKGPRPL